MKNFPKNSCGNQETQKTHENTREKRMRKTKNSKNA